jgi:hypothetical protein
MRVDFALDLIFFIENQWIDKYCLKYEQLNKNVEFPKQHRGGGLDSHTVIHRIGG